MGWSVAAEEKHEERIGPDIGMRKAEIDSIGDVPLDPTREHIVVQTHLDGLPAKRWAVKTWRGVLSGLRDRYPGACIHVLDPAGAPLAGEGIVVQDRLIFPQAIRLVERCSLLVSVDSWSKYVAGWRNIPQLVIVPDQTPDSSEPSTPDASAGGLDFDLRRHGGNRWGSKANGARSGNELVNVQHGKTTEMPGVGGQQGHTQDGCAGGYQAIGDARTSGKMEFFHQGIGPIPDFRREFKDLDFEVVQKPPQKVVFLFVPATLHKFHPGNDGDHPPGESFHSGNRFGIPSQAPDQNIRVNQHGVSAFAVA
jgi:hypothetical protein